VAAYGFNEGTGTSSADRSGHGNTAYISAASWASTGKYGRALSFNGTSSVVVVRDSTSLDLTGGMTLEAWVRPAATMSGWRNVLRKERAGGWVYRLAANSDVNRPALSIYATVQRTLSAGAALQPGTWTHIAATYDGRYHRLYINGLLAGTQSQSGPIRTSSGALQIGGNLTGNLFKGLIDEIRVYNRALSVTEIRADMNAAVK
jgi:hypothetical protein